MDAAAFGFLGVLAGGLIAGLVSYRSAREGRASTERVAREAREAALEQLRITDSYARDRAVGDLAMRRREDLYVDLWVTMSGVIAWSRKQVPRIEVAGAEQTDQAPQFTEEVHRAEARAALLASTEVDEILTRWARMLMAFGNNVRYFKSMSAAPDGEDWGDRGAVWAKIDDQRSDLYDIFRKFERQAADELGGPLRAKHLTKAELLAGAQRAADESAAE